MKACIKCEQTKELSEFYKLARRPDGLHYYCKDCIRENTRKYLSSPAGKLSKKNWRLNHPEQVSQSSIRCSKRARQKPEFQAARREYIKRYRKIPHNRIDNSFSNAIRANLKNQKKNRKWETLVGYTLQGLMNHLEAQFVSGMTWDNYGKWHIDHIKPKALFNVTSVECSDFKELWQLSNLQPLWADDNIRKGANYLRSFCCVASDV